MSATIYDIARLTGYNPGTVSRALHNDPRVRENTRKKIREVSDLLGYVPNMAAKSLTTGKTRIIAVVSGTAANSPLSALMLSLNKILIEHDYLMMSLFYNNEEQFRQCMNRLRSGICDGAILFSPSMKNTDIPELETLIKMKFPLVCFDQWIPEWNIPVITNDADDSIQKMTEELLNCGMDGAFLHTQYRNTVADWRRKCAKRLLKKMGIPFTEDLEKLPSLIKKNKIRKLAVYSDSVSGLDRLGNKLPRQEKCSVIGGIFDHWNLLVPGFFSGLILCVQDFDEESKAAAELLFQMIDGKEVKPERILIPPKEIIVPTKEI